MASNSNQEAQQVVKEGRIQRSRHAKCNVLQSACGRHEHVAGACAEVRRCDARIDIP